MAEGNITRIVGGKNIIETEEWIVYTNKFTAYAEKGSHFTADGGTTLGNPNKAPSVGHYFKKAWWSSDKEGNKKITTAKIGDTVYFQVEMTDSFPQDSLPKDEQQKISFELYEFTGNKYSIGYMYIFGPIIYLDKKPKKENEIKYVTWEDKNKNDKIDPDEEYSKKPYNKEIVNGKRAVISLILGDGLKSFAKKADELKLCMYLSYASENVDLPRDEDEYLEVELFCCDAKCRQPWDDLVKHDPRKIAIIQDSLNEKSKKHKIKGSSRALRIARSLQGKWKILSIYDAYGEKINMDYYSVKITKLPTIKDTIWSADLLFDFVRKNLGLFLNGNIASFYAYDNDEKLIWESTNPITAVMKFHVTVPDPINSGVVFDDAAVICTSFIPNQSWIFSPVETADDHKHPVSGNRQFGLRKLNDGYEFYIRGADRLTGIDDVTLGGQAAFDGADKLWTGFQKNLIAFLKRHGGEAEIDESKYEWKRCKWETK